MQPGNHLLINIPRKAAENALLRVDANAQRLGGQCTDLYFQELNITGAWANAKQSGGFHYKAQDAVGERSHWARFGRVQLKVAQGRTGKGTKYLNFYVKHLSRAGFSVGGLLGEDDHSLVETPLESCAHRLAL
ncbi:unnamed protein product [Prorocentrum cordatum]|nr:unnamed protein product [Polarella glacialis]